jgi:23S rRNA (cytosine1962-C5)-methyltransferase
VSSTARVFLEPGHVKPVWAGHPWVYAQAIAHVEGSPAAGDVVEVRDRQGNLLGRGFWSPGSAIPVRLVTRDPEVALDEAALARRVAAAVGLRERVLGLPSTAPARGTDGFRLVHSEGDDLPGVVADRYGDTVCEQLLPAGKKRREEANFDAFAALPGIHRVVEVPGGDGQRREGIAATLRTVRGEPVTSLRFHERGIGWSLPADLGQKTGYYFDQRDLRARVAALANGKRVLDAYSYVGGFGLAAARGGASHVACVDESALALEVGAENARANGLEDRIEFIKSDARRVMQDAKAAYDLVVVDPPRLAPSRHAREQALVMFSKLAELGCRATKPGGLLVLCSCSAAVDLAALTRSLATGAVRANVTPIVLERHFQGFDHPVPAAFPEGLYLKALLARIHPR